LKRWDLGLNYTLSWSKRKFTELNDGEWFNFLYDRRHSFNANGLYKINNTTKLSILWVYYSGQRYNALEGRIEDNPMVPGYVIYDGINNGKPPGYHRMDISLTKKFLFSNSRLLEIGLSAPAETEKSEAKISFTFKDDPGNDYYAYQIVRSKDGVPLTNGSPYEIPFGNLLDDKDFTNQSKTISYQLLRTTQSRNGQSVVADQFIVYLHHLSRNTYDYYRSLLEYNSFYEDTFAGETPVINNIKNGYGFIGMSYVDSTTVNLKK